MDVNGMKSETQKLTEVVMRASGQTVCDVPTIPSEDDCLLRAKLTLEEALEKITALGVQVMDFMGHPITKESNDLRFVFMGHKHVNLIEIIDGAGDQIVIACGTLSTLGIPDLPILHEINQSNLRKIGPDGQIARRADGKFLKPCGWHPPNIRRVLNDIFPEQLTADEAVI
jgi:predicted HAD superfamily Cof-like phosphohydrolase